MPIHGEYKQRNAHAALARSLNIKPSKIIMAQNGDVIEISSDSYKIIDNLNLEQILIDGRDVYNMESGIIKERNVMSNSGIVFVTLILLEGKLIVPPKISTRGFIGDKETGIIKQLSTEIEDILEKLLTDGAKTRDIRDILKKNLKKYKHYLLMH